MHGEREGEGVPDSLSYQRNENTAKKKREGERGTEVPIRPKPLSSSFCPSPALNIVSSLLLWVLSGRLVMNLIRELLTFLNLDCTLSVFDAEAIEGRGLQVFIV